MSQTVSSHFKLSEISCKCGCGYSAVSADLLQLAEDIRAMLGGCPMIVHSCCRCPTHNKAVGGKSDSKHLTGHAMDFHINGLKPETIYNAIVENADRLPLLGGVGLYSWGVHIDIDKADDGHLRTWTG